jgi:hypothetical protein
VAGGDIPVVPFVTAGPAHVLTQVAARTSSAVERAVQVRLAAVDAGAVVFDLVLVLRAGRWLVDAWTPALVLSAPSAQ